MGTQEDGRTWGGGDRGTKGQGNGRMWGHREDLDQGCGDMRIQGDPVIWWGHRGPWGQGDTGMKGCAGEGTQGGDTGICGGTLGDTDVPLNSSRRLQAWPGRHQQAQVGIGGLQGGLQGGTGALWGGLGRHGGTREIQGTFGDTDLALNSSTSPRTWPSSARSRCRSCPSASSCRRKVSA